MSLRREGSKAAVSSTTVVQSLDEDRVDGIERSAVAQETDLQNLEGIRIRFCHAVIDPPGECYDHITEACSRLVVCRSMVEC